MSGQIVVLKVLCSVFILALMAIAGYFNMVYTWGVDIKSMTSFFVFFFISLLLHTVMQIVMSIKGDE